MSDKPRIGCLALQGCVERHRPHIEAAGARFSAVKTAKQFDEIDAFILPGGESTTMLKLIDRFNLWDVLTEQFAQKPVWGICAGSILMAEKVLVQKNKHPDESQDPEINSLDPGSSLGCSKENWSTQKSFGLLPITVKRNGYGRQLDSHNVNINGYEVSLIRAPVIIPPKSSPPAGGGEEGASAASGGEFKILAEHQGTPVWVKKGNKMATTFHPELTFDFPSPMHQMFVDMVKSYAAQKAA